MKQKKAAEPPTLIGKIHPELRKYVCYCLYKSAMRWKSMFDETLADHNLVAPQFGILVLLDLEGLMTQNELASYMAMDKATMVRMIDILEDKKWVLRVQNKEDRRANHLQLTKAGKQAIHKMEELRKKA